LFWDKGKPNENARATLAIPVNERIPYRPALEQETLLR
jgi:hypothetical protein